MNLPDIFLDELGIQNSPMHMKVFPSQQERFQSLMDLGATAKLAHSPLTLNEDGKVLLKEGTIFHGCDYQKDKLESISKSGIITGQMFGIPEDGETFYCADFYRVPSDITMEELDRTFPFHDGRTPFGGRGQNTVSFLVGHETENETLKELLKYDCYREHTVESELTKQFVNVKGLLEPKEMLSSILYGVPQSAIYGITLGDALLQDREALDTLRELFPNCYLFTRNGTILVDPYRKMEEEQIDLIRKNYVLEKEKERLSQELQMTQDSLEKEKVKYRDLVKNILTLGEEDAIKAVLDSIDWQGDVEGAKLFFGVPSHIESNTNHESKTR